jgi:hypothetical protein
MRWTPERKIIEKPNFEIITFRIKSKDIVIPKIDSKLSTDIVNSLFEIHTENGNNLVNRCLDVANFFGKKLNEKNKGDWEYFSIKTKELRESRDIFHSIGLLKINDNLFLSIDGCFNSQKIVIHNNSLGITLKNLEKIYNSGVWEVKLKLNKNNSTYQFV